MYTLNASKNQYELANDITLEIVQEVSLNKLSHENSNLGKL